MRLRELLNLVIVVTVAACSGTTGTPPPSPSNPSPTGEPAATPTETTPPASTDPVSTALLADGQPCVESTSCMSGVCEGQGCTQAEPGTCAAKARACTKDLRDYCGCDGVTFKTSGSCPGRRFASKGACAGGAP